MKKITDRIEIETLLGGIFGAIAIIAIIVEMALAGFDAAAIAGGLKDIAGTVVTVMVFIFAAKALFQKEDTSFNAVFEKEMKQVEEKYMPLLRYATANGDEKRAKKLAGLIRYELSTNIDALIDGETKNFATFFEFDISTPEKISFSINKSTFMGRSSEDFTPLKKEITLKIENGILRRFPEYRKNVKATSSGFDVVFDSALTTEEDAVRLVNLIDSITLLYIAECKK